MKAYAIKPREGKIFLTSIRTDEQVCIANFSEYDMYKWEKRLEMGYTCVPVEITEVKPNIQ